MEGSFECAATKSAIQEELENHCIHADKHTLEHFSISTGVLTWV